MPTMQEATDDILDIFKAAWDTTGHVVDYENTPSTNGVAIPPTSDTPWARVSLRHATANQASLSGGLGTKRYDRTGILFVQIFIPSGEGLSRAYSLGRVVTNAFEGVASPRNVWFRNVRLNEVGVDGDWYQVNVMVDFIYDEIK